MADRAHSTSRRALLAGLTTSTVLTLPALAAPAHPDDELLDLWRCRGLACEAQDAAGVRQDAVEAATVFPGPPDALFVRDGDAAFGFTDLARERDDGRLWYPVYSAGSGVPGERLRRRQIRIVDRPFPVGHALHGTDETIGRRVPWPEAQWRADAIVAAWDGWKAEQRAISAASGLDAANAAWEASVAARADLDDAIAAAAARTLDGLAVKARLIQVDLDEESDPDPDLVAGLVADILAMQARA